MSKVVPLRSQDKKVSRSMGMYSTYSFVDKDPIIDVLRTAIQDEAAVRGMSFNLMCKMLAETAGCGPSTLHGWFAGKTRMPKFAVLNSIFVQLGCDLHKLAGKELGISTRRKRA
jgi:hypothetical protein